MLTPNVLAVCANGGVGDLLAATPAIRALSRHFGDRINVLATPYAAPILQDRPDVKRVVIDVPGESSRDLSARLSADGYTHAVVFWSTARVASALRGARIPVRVGQSRRLYSWTYTKRVPVRTEAGDVTSHWTDVQMDYARALGASPVPDDFRIDIRLRPVDLERAAAFLDGERIGADFAVLHAARGLPLQDVRWPVERFAAIGDAVSRAFAMPVLLTGSAADVPTIARIGAAMREPHVLAAGKTDLMMLSAVLSRAALVVALDSGPTHIAAALGAPTVAIFALRSDLPDRWRPLGARVALVRPDYPCPPWHRKENCPDFACYANLSPGAVVAAARTVASEDATPAPA